MKKIIKIIVIILVVLLVSVFGYKLINYYRYTMDKPEGVENVVKGLKNKKEMTITKQSLSENEYVTVNHVKVRNVLDGYEEKENSTTKISYKKDNYVINFLGGYLNTQLVDGLKNKDDMYLGNINYGFLKGNIKDADTEDFLKKNNIKNDIDYYDYVKDHYFIESNLFTDTKTLKQNYTFNLYTSLTLPEIDGWTVLKGDITGLITENSNKDGTAYQICIIDNDKRYIIVTDDPRFKDESFMIDFISTIEIV